MTPTDAELLALARTLSPRQRIYLRTLADADVHTIPKRTGDALVKRGWAVRISQLILEEDWVFNNKVLCRKYGDEGQWVHKFAARDVGFHVACYLQRMHESQLAPGKRA